MRTPGRRRTAGGAVAAVAALAAGIAGLAAAEATAARSGPLAGRAVAAPVGPGCADVPAEGAGSFADMADDPAATAVASNPELSTLVLAIDAAGLTAALDGEGPFTLFAPNDDAFELIPTNVLESILADGELLNSILTYHVVSSEALSPDELVAAGTVEPAAGGPIEVTRDGDTIVLNGGEATVLCGGIPVANGYVYIIDHVLQPPGDGLAGGDSTGPGSSGPGSSGPGGSGPDVTGASTPG